MKYRIAELKKCGLALLGGVIGLLILALAPTLLQQSSFSCEKYRLALARLVPMEEEMLEAEEMEKEPEPPPEPEILPDPPELEPPEIDLAEIEPPQTSYDNAGASTGSGISLPSLTGLGLKGVKISAKNFSGKLAKAPVPGLPKHGPPRVRFNSDEVDQKPQGIATMQPMYPYRAKRLGIEGEVHIRFLVDRKGKTNLFKILKSNPPGEFDSAVEKTVKRWKFKPAVKDGRIVETWVETSIVFNLT